MSNGNRLTPEQVQTILLMTREGCSAKHIGEVVGCSDRTVVRVRAAGDARLASAQFVPLSQEQKDFAQYLLDDGAPYNEVARTLGVSRTTVEKYFPGYRWSKKQAAEFTVLAEKFRRLEAS
ncbi:DNA binding protein [Mycobacterium phage Yoshi]|uniref:Helix-turn-helix DNA-binding domain protein n=3 Tax=Gracegardnervirinae TaxID=2946632 RepID=A0A385DZN4_9CAUD|nr:DNA binding protein [Mycobacterium phage Yoshi]YP_009841091.1 DNA binding protein [Mycobacterium phage Renaud18]YP_009848884.1 DNA binding protein [Mycobacterium phage ThetaBob]AEK07823.1 helix-turn-helix DNA binding protein [Mycobacterium phage Yoshi]AXQ64973.1 helix-turn-helix DNA-binding domain protein [Mycobacterium phage Renaud18]QDF19952.1 helix-turn-helix DNA binding domain protein [Mycobacterium phage ThetaBob]